MQHPRRDRRRTSAVRALAVVGWAMVLTGCAGYRLGPTNGLPAGSRSVQVNLFQNQTVEPRLTEAVATALRRQLQQDGTFRLATQDDGQLVVNGTIVRFERQAVSFQAADVITPLDFEVTLDAHITAVERGTGKTVLDRDVHGRTTVRVTADLPSAERQAVPVLAADLARRVASLLVDGTW